MQKIILHISISFTTCMLYFYCMTAIGKIIEVVVREKRITVTEFAKLINTNRNNVYHIFRRETIDTGLLQKICDVTGYDFFKHFISENSKSEIAKVESAKLKSDSETFRLQKQIEELENILLLTESRLKDKEVIIELLGKK